MWTDHHDGGFAGLVAIPGEDCFYEVRAGSRAGFSNILDLRPIAID